MINYFDAAENTLRSRSMLEKALKNLMRRQERIMRHNAPSGYNTTIKSFSTLTNQLISLLPEKEKKTAGDELMQFITKPKAAGR